MKPSWCATGDPIQSFHHQNGRSLLVSFYPIEIYVFLFSKLPGNNIFSLDHWVLYKREQRILATISMMDWLSARTSRPNIDFILQWTQRTNKYIFLPNNVSYYPWLAQRSGRIVLPSWHFYPSVRLAGKPAIIFIQIPHWINFSHTERGRESERERANIKEWISFISK